MGLYLLKSWVIVCVQMERYVHCLYVHGLKGGTFIRCSDHHLPDEPALFLRCNNFSDPDMHITLSKQELHCCNHIYTCLAMDFSTARTSHEF